jgi:hypothetical protein
VKSSGAESNTTSYERGEDKNSSHHAFGTNAITSCILPFSPPSAPDGCDIQFENAILTDLQEDPSLVSTLSCGQNVDTLQESELASDDLLSQDVDIVISTTDFEFSIDEDDLELDLTFDEQNNGLQDAHLQDGTFATVSDSGSNSDEGENYMDLELGEFLLDVMSEDEYDATLIAECSF